MLPYLFREEKRISKHKPIKRKKAQAKEETDNLITRIINGELPGKIIQEITTSISIAKIPKPLGKLKKDKDKEELN